MLRIGSMQHAIHVKEGAYAIRQVMARERPDLRQIVLMNCMRASRPVPPFLQVKSLYVTQQFIVIQRIGLLIIIIRLYPAE